MAALSLPGDDSPITLPMIASEPAVPIETQATYVSMCGATATVIGRLWADASKPTCGGLCDTKCTFRGGLCTVTAKGRISSDLAPSFASRLNVG